MFLRDQYLGEFVDHGGVVTLLEVLTQPQSNEETKAEALCLLLVISDAGRKYKELICQSCGACSFRAAPLLQPAQQQQHCCVSAGAMAAAECLTRAQVRLRRVRGCFWSLFLMGTQSMRVKSTKV